MGGNVLSPVNLGMATAPLDSYPQGHMLPLGSTSAESLGTGSQGLPGALEIWDTVEQPAGTGTPLCCLPACASKVDLSAQQASCR